MFANVLFRPVVGGAFALCAKITLMKRHVTIPQTPLQANLARAEAIKRQMAQLLAELNPDTSWRHDPIGWLARQPTETDQTSPGSPSEHSRPRP